MEHKTEYSILCEEEGVPCKIDYTDNKEIKEIHIKTSHVVPNSAFRTDVFKMSDDNYGPKPS